ncbi:hypothetical protein ACET3Z_011025 [Daucus carota]
MDKVLNPYDKECMKMAMLRQEEMFKEQVFELHRLYQIQKMLMKNVSSQSKRNEEKVDQYMNFSHDMRQPAVQVLDLEQPAEEKIGAPEVGVESEIELTLGPSNYYPRRKAAETPRTTSDSGLSFSSSSTGSSDIKRTDSKIQRMTDRRTEESTAQKWGLVEVSNSNPSFLSGRRNSSDMEQDRLQQPPWMFPVLSLKMT